MSTSKVKVESDRDRLRLRWTHIGRRYTLSLGLSDSPINRRLAERAATTIDLDILSGHFDPTLRKYKTSDQLPDSIAVDKLFERFINSKKSELHRHSLTRYKSTAGRLREFWGERQVIEVTKERAILFREWLTQRVSPLTVRDRISSCSTCWDWAVERNITLENPWKGISVRVPSKKKDRPFSDEETYLILDLFDNREHPFSFYSDFVHFLFYTGCRIGEAIGLRWENIENDRVWVGESISRGIRKETKNNKPRSFSIPPTLYHRLKRRARVKERELVFTAPKGGAIDDKNFNQRPWRSCLKVAEIPYRRPYLIRATAVVRMLRSGMSPLEIAEITGHNVDILYKHYALPMEAGVIPEI